MDYSRVNEFGVSGDMLDEAGAIKADAGGQIEDKSAQEQNGDTQPKSEESKKED